MNRLETHLKQTDLVALHAGGFDHAIGMMYAWLEEAALTGSDTIKLTPDGFFRFKEGESVRTSPGVPGPQTYQSFRVALQKIIERDEIVRRYLLVVSDEPHEMIVKLIDDLE